MTAWLNRSTTASALAAAAEVSRLALSSSRVEELRSSCTEPIPGVSIRVMDRNVSLAR